MTTSNQEVALLHITSSSLSSIQLYEDNSSSTESTVLCVVYDDVSRSASRSHVPDDPYSLSVNDLLLQPLQSYSPEACRLQCSGGSGMSVDPGNNNVSPSRGFTLVGQLQSVSQTAQELIDDYLDRETNPRRLVTVYPKRKIKICPIPQSCIDDIKDLNRSSKKSISNNITPSTDHLTAETLRSKTDSKTTDNTRALSPSRSRAIRPWASKCRSLAYVNQYDSRARSDSEVAAAVRSLGEALAIKFHRLLYTEPTKRPAKCFCKHICDTFEPNNCSNSKISNFQIQIKTSKEQYKEEIISSPKFMCPYCATLKLSSESKPRLESPSLKSFENREYQNKALAQIKCSGCKVKKSEPQIVWSKLNETPEIHWPLTSASTTSLPSRRPPLTIPQVSSSPCSRTKGLEIIIRMPNEGSESRLPSPGTSISSQANRGRPKKRTYKRSKGTGPGPCFKRTKRSKRLGPCSSLLGLEKTTQCSDSTEKQPEKNKKILPTVELESATYKISKSKLESGKKRASRTTTSQSFDDMMQIRCPRCGKHKKAKGQRLTKTRPHVSRSNGGARTGIDDLGTSVQERSTSPGPDRRSREIKEANSCYVIFKRTKSGGLQPCDNLAALVKPIEKTSKNKDKSRHNVSYDFPVPVSRFDTQTTHTKRKETALRSRCTGMREMLPKSVIPTHSVGTGAGTGWKPCQLKDASCCAATIPQGDVTDERFLLTDLETLKDSPNTAGSYVPEDSNQQEKTRPKKRIIFWPRLCFRCFSPDAERHNDQLNGAEYLGYAPPVMVAFSKEFHGNENGNQPLTRENESPPRESKSTKNQKLLFGLKEQTSEKETFCEKGRYSQSDKKRNFKEYPKSIKENQPLVKKKQMCSKKSCSNSDCPLKDSKTCDKPDNPLKDVPTGGKQTTRIENYCNHTCPFKTPQKNGNQTTSTKRSTKSWIIPCLFKGSYTSKSQTPSLRHNYATSGGMLKISQSNVWPSRNENAYWSKSLFRNNQTSKEGRQRHGLTAAYSVGLEAYSPAQLSGSWTKTCCCKIDDIPSECSFTSATSGDSSSVQSLNRKSILSDFRSDSLSSGKSTRSAKKTTFIVPCDNIGQLKRKKKRTKPRASPVHLGACMCEPQHHKIKNKKKESVQIVDCVKGPSQSRKTSPTTCQCSDPGPLRSSDFSGSGSESDESSIHFESEMQPLQMPKQSAISSACVCPRILTTPELTSTRSQFSSSIYSGSGMQLSKEAIVSSACECPSNLLRSTSSQGKYGLFLKSRGTLPITRGSSASPCGGRESASSPEEMEVRRPDYRQGYSTDSQTRIEARQRLEKLLDSFTQTVPEIKYKPRKQGNRRKESRKSTREGNFPCSGLKNDRTLYSTSAGSIGAAGSGLSLTLREKSPTRPKTLEMSTMAELPCSTCYQRKSAPCISAVESDTSINVTSGIKLSIPISSDLPCGNVCLLNLFSDSDSSLRSPPCQPKAAVKLYDPSRYKGNKEGVISLQQYERNKRKKKKSKLLTTDTVTDNKKRKKKTVKAINCLPGANPVKGLTCQCPFPGAGPVTGANMTCQCPPQGANPVRGANMTCQCPPQGAGPVTGANMTCQCPPQGPNPVRGANMTCQCPPQVSENYGVPCMCNVPGGQPGSGFGNPSRFRRQYEGLKLNVRKKGPSSGFSLLSAWCPLLKKS